MENSSGEGCRAPVVMKRGCRAPVVLGKGVQSSCGGGRDSVVVGEGSRVSV